jgi:radical S-adenosyl methionine domain-containing protein 2
VAAAKAAGLSTSMVTNGSLLDAASLLRLAGSLDWLAFSVDASTDALHAAIGRGVRGEVARGRSRHLEHVREVWRLAQGMGFRLKLNTVVTQATL